MKYKNSGELQSWIIRAAAGSSRSGRGLSSESTEFLAEDTQYYRGRLTMICVAGL
jgi:hypothetical protein